MTDRVFVYPGQTPKSADFLQSQINTMLALGYALQGTFGTQTSTFGLTCTPTSPASLTVNVGPGAIITETVVDSSAFGGIAANSNPLVKIGINQTATPFTLTAPTTSGQSINYLIEAIFQEVDGNPLELSYYNAISPTNPYTGPGGNGVAQNTTRSQIVGLQLKAGSAAPTGSQSTPGADVGWSPLYVVTVNYGQTTISAAQITTATGAPFVGGGAVSSGRLLRTTIFDIISGTQQFSVDGAAFTSVASTSFTSLGGTNRMQVEVLGAGASSAGAPATGASQAACGGNGGDGAYLFKTLLRARDTTYFDTPIAVTVGVGGVGQLGANGLPGGNSSFGSLVVAGGSGGSTAGPSGASTVVSSGGNGGAKPTAGDINAAGLQGNGTLIISFQGVITIPGPSPIAGHGTGGIGTSNPISSAAITGVSGQSGIVIVREYS